MENIATYSLAARLSVSKTEATIDRADGKSVTLDEAEFSDLILELAVDETGRLARAAHHRAVLHRFFTKKTMEPAKPILRVVA